MEEAAATTVELERLQIDILHRISVLESSILPESSSPSLPDDESQTVSRLSAILRSGGVNDFSFKRVSPDYYDWPLESRRGVLGASSVDHLCKSIVLVRQVYCFLRLWNIVAFSSLLEYHKVYIFLPRTECYAIKVVPFHMGFVDKCRLILKLHQIFWIAVIATTPNTMWLWFRCS